MNRKQLMKRVRSITRDLSNSTFTESDIIDFLNEGVDRVRQVIPEFIDMSYLDGQDDVPTHLPAPYHHLLATYAAASLYFQDDRHHQATVKMNEFESKLDTLKSRFQTGEAEVVGADGLPIYADMKDDHVRNVYFNTRHGGVDVDAGVDGVNY